MVFHIPPRKLANGSPNLFDGEPEEVHGVNYRAPENFTEGCRGGGYFRVRSLKAKSHMS